MSYHDSILKALNEELEAVEKAPGKGVQDSSVSQQSKPSDKMSSDNRAQSGDNGTVGGDQGGLADKAKEHGQAAAGAEQDAVEKADGKSVQDSGEKAANFSGSGSDGKAVEKANGEGMQSREDTPSKDLKGKHNAVGESFDLPHDVLVEKDGKHVTLFAGTRVTLVKEAEEEENPFAVADDGDITGDGEVDEEDFEAAEVESDDPIDQLVDAIDQFSDSTEGLEDAMKEYLGVEAEEEAHHSDYDYDYDEEKGEEGEEMEYDDEEMNEAGY